MSSDKQTTLPAADELAWADEMAPYANEIIAAILRINTCRAAIHEYEKAGISGDAHDIEHRQMLITTVRKVKGMWP